MKYKIFGKFLLWLHYIIFKKLWLMGYSAEYLRTQGWYRVMDIPREI